MNDDFNYKITKEDSDAATEIVKAALAKASELRVAPMVMMLAIVSLHEHARDVAGATKERGDELFTDLVQKLRAQQN